ncbi:MAG: T9SS type A sorting domain-containing protein [Bacteroidales bacterium]|nr:T9SS type A sorting domain-containing protein [Bacteroidales bacterium]
MTVRYVLSLFEINEDGEPDTETHGEQQKQMQKTDVFSVVLEKQTISVYPNPTRGTITLGISPLDTDTRNFVCLYDMSGRLLQTVPIRSDLTSLEITGTAGLYLLDIHLGQNVSKWKIIKE